VITSTTIRKITNGFVITTVETATALGPMMMGSERYFETLDGVVAYLTNAGFATVGTTEQQ
jgi:hypothetical protein